MAKLVAVPVPDDVPVDEVIVTWHGEEEQFVQWVTAYKVSKDEIEVTDTAEYRLLVAYAEIEGVRVKLYGHATKLGEAFVVVDAGLIP